MHVQHSLVHPRGFAPRTPHDSRTPLDAVPGCSALSRSRASSAGSEPSDL